MIAIESLVRWFSHWLTDCGGSVDAVNVRNVFIMLTLIKLVLDLKGTKIVNSELRTEIGYIRQLEANL